MSKATNKHTHTHAQNTRRWQLRQQQQDKISKVNLLEETTEFGKKGTNVEPGCFESVEFPSSSLDLLLLHWKTDEFLFLLPLDNVTGDVLLVVCFVIDDVII